MSRTQLGDSGNHDSTGEWATMEYAKTLLTATELAALLRTSRKAIYAMAERRQLPGVRRIGRRLLFDRVEVLEWLDHTCVSSPRR